MSFIVIVVIVVIIITVLLPTLNGIIFFFLAFIFFIITFLLSSQKCLCLSFDHFLRFYFLCRNLFCCLLLLRHFPLLSFLWFQNFRLILLLLLQLLLCIPLLPLLLLLLHLLRFLVCDFGKENRDLVSTDAQSLCCIERCLRIPGTRKLNKPIACSFLLGVGRDVCMASLGKHLFQVCSANTRCQPTYEQSGGIESAWCLILNFPLL